MKHNFDANISRYPCTEEVEERQKAVAEIERLRDMVGSLAEDLRIALGIIEQQGGEVPRVWIRALKQNAEAAEQEVALKDAALNLDTSTAAGCIDLPLQREKKKRASRKRIPGIQS